MSICTGTQNPATCPSCRVRNATRCLIPPGAQVTPMNEAAREAMDSQGTPYDHRQSEALERFMNTLEGKNRGNR